MVTIKCPRCSQVFRDEHDPKFGELLPVGSVQAMEMLEKVMVENALLREAVKKSDKLANEALSDMRAAKCFEENARRELEKKSSAEEIVRLIRESRRIRLEANKLMDALDADL